MSEEPAERRTHELGDVFLDAIYGIPGGDKIKQCIQCGTCSGSCPTSYAMDYSPREIIAALRAGMLDRVLKSNTVWLCTSCYYCTVRCPSGIKITEMMYELKRLGEEFGLVQKGSITPTVSRAFVNMVDNYGRVHETMLVMGVFLKTKPWTLLRMMPMGMKLIARGRLPFLPHRIKGISEMNKCAGAMTEAIVGGLHPGGASAKEV